MTIKDQAKKLATGASVALATSGLSSCNDNGAVDPLPPPLQCNTVNTGQTLVAIATRSGDRLDVRVNTNTWLWRVDAVRAISGATVVSTTLPRPNSQDPLDLVLQLATSSTTQVVFELDVTILGFENESCGATRRFTATISPGGIVVSAADRDPLPLSARQRASIGLTAQQGRTVHLVARTPYLGARAVWWSVSAGELDSTTGDAVRWTLPEAGGIYQAELVIDYGEDGFAYDALLVELA